MKYLYDEERLRNSQLKMLEILNEIDEFCKKNNINYWLDSGTLLGAIRHNGFIPWDDDLDICMLRKDYNTFISGWSKEENNKYYFKNIYNNDELENQFLKIENKDDKNIFVDIFPMDLYYENDKKYHIKSKLNNMILFYWMKSAKIKKPLIKNIKGNIVKIISKVYYSIRKKYSYKNINNKVKYYIKNLNLNDIDINDKKIKYIDYGVEVPFKNKVKIKDCFPLIDWEFEDKKYPIPNNYDYYLKNLYGNYMQLPKEEDRKPSHYCY